MLYHIRDQLQPCILYNDHAILIVYHKLKQLTNQLVYLYLKVLQLQHEMLALKNIDKQVNWQLLLCQNFTFHSFNMSIHDSSKGVCAHYLASQLHTVWTAFLRCLTSKQTRFSQLHYHRITVYIIFISGVVSDARAHIFL